MNDALAQPTSSQMVPSDFAEKAMASLMQMHTELMDEKERRVELFRKLMEREQVVAELRMYVKLLEEKLNPPKLDKALERPEELKRVEARPEPVAARALSVEIPAPSPHVKSPETAPPQAPRVARPKVDNWKTW